MFHVLNLLPLYFQADAGTSPSQLDSERDHALLTNSGSDMQLAISHALVLFYETFPKAAIRKIEIDYSNKYNDYLIKIKGIDVENSYEIKIDLSDHRLLERSMTLLPDRKQDGVGLAREAISLKEVLPFDTILAKVQEEISQSDFYSCELEGYGRLLKWEFHFRNGQEMIQIDLDGETGHIFDVTYD